MKKAIIIIASLVLLKQAVAQQPDLVFHHLTQKDGLSYNIVNCFFKDSRGMLWIGTYNGLNRYDGAHFYIFRKGKDKNSLPDNTVHKLAEDKKGNIWGATDNGIFCYNQEQNNFKTYHTPGETDWLGITSVVCDRQGIVWAANTHCLVLYNTKADSFERAPVVAGDIALAKDLNIRKNGMLESPDGKGLWLATNKGIAYYDKALQKMISHKNTADSVLFTGKSSSALYATSFGHYWYYDNKNKRLVGFDPVAKKVEYILQAKEFEKGGAMATVFEDNNHLLWMSTWQNEVYTIDYLNGNKVTRIQHDKNNLSSIAGDFFWDALQDADGTIWLGTVGGISKSNTKQSFYKVHRFADNLFAQPNPAIEFISENKNDSSWWVTTNKGFLINYNAYNLKLSNYDFNKMPLSKNGQRPENVTRMLFFKKNILLFSGNGAWVKESTAAFKPFNLPTVPDSIVFNDGALMNDSIMYCTNYKKLWRWNIGSNYVEEIKFEKKLTIENGEDPYIIYLTPTAAGKLWTLNATGWLSYVEGNKLIPQKFLKQDADAGVGFYTNMIADKSGNLWLTRKGEGLVNYNTTEKKYKLYKQYDGLVMDHVMAAAADNNGKIWTGAYNQFSVFNPQLNSFNNFTMPLSPNNYNYLNLMSPLANGNVLANIANNLVEFFPNRLKASLVTAQPLISSLSTAGIEKLFVAKKAVSLLANENSILLKFGLLADNEATPYDMLYIMEGAEKAWTTAGSNFEASYNSLSPGNYTFKVKAVAKDKSWQTNETVLQIHIATPFYKSWWFLLLLSAILITAVYLLYRYRLRQHQQVMQLENKAQLLEKEKTIVMYESLKQQLNPHFLFNSLTSLSGLIESDQQVANEFLEQMSGIYRYILKSGDNETVLLSDEIKFVKQYITLQQTRFKNGLQVNINVPDEYLHYKIAPVTLQNLIENAIKHNIIDAESPLVINIFIDDEYLVVQNNLQKKNVVETSNKKGLVQFAALYKYLTTKPLTIEETLTYFTIKIPLL